MCGALAIRPPSASKTAQEKSSRSLMLTECAVDCRRTPICSATDMNRLLKISSMHRVGAGVHLGLAGPRRYPGKQQVAAVADDGPPAGLDHGGGEFLGDDGRAVDGVPGPQPGPREQVHLRPGPPPVNIGTRAATAVALARTRWGISVAVGFLPGRGDLDGNGFDDDRLVAHEEGEAAGVFGLERGGHLLQRADRDDDGGVGALVAQVRAVRGGDPAGRLRPPPVPRRGRRASSGPVVSGSSAMRSAVSGASTACSRMAIDVGQPDPVRGQHAGQRVDEHLGHAQRVGDGAGVLAACPAEHVQDVPVTS